MPICSSRRATRGCFNENRRPSVSPAVALVTLTALLASGCGDKPMREGFARVYGTVTLDGQPLPNAQIAFDTDKGTSYGRTNSNGEYVAEYSRGLSGAGKGEATVRISTSVVFPDEDTTGLKYDDNLGDFRKPELVPPRYNDDSELTVEITDDGAPYDFHLETEQSALPNDDEST